MSSVIKAENISKSYLISQQQQFDSDSLAVKLSSFATGLKQRLVKPFSTNTHKTAYETFWALKDIDFEISHGQRVGIIGGNGAGKSTLLKILSRITQPTSGKITLHGRVSSLLEVGTGFHPDLTGRENIFLNGAILGMSRTEIRKKFDAIVDFSEVEKFLDTPVKRYSSGMYVRLAFAIAAHLEPDILIVDEVLAVGDASFQEKCLGKMSEVSSEGRTVLFVSHNINAIQQLCDSAMHMQQGKIIDYVNGIDEVEGLISQYYSEQISHGTKYWNASDNTTKNPYFSPLAMYACNAEGEIYNGVIPSDKELWICLEGNIESPHSELALGYVVFDEYGNPIFVSKISDGTPDCWPSLKKGGNQLKCRIPPRFLNEGKYTFKLVGHLMGNKTVLFTPRETTVGIEVHIRGGLSDSPHWTKKRLGVVAPVLDWKND
jgi:lipopolysaccharide transport system ATP-binding protein